VGGKKGKGGKRIPIHDQKCPRRVRTEEDYFTSFPAPRRSKRGREGKEKRKKGEGGRGFPPLKKNAGIWDDFMLPHPVLIERVEGKGRGKGG